MLFFPPEGQLNQTNGLLLLCMSLLFSFGWCFLCCCQVVIVIMVLYMRYIQYAYIVFCCVAGYGLQMKINHIYIQGPFGSLYCHRWSQICVSICLTPEWTWVDHLPALITWCVTSITGEKCVFWSRHRVWTAKCRKNDMYCCSVEPRLLSNWWNMMLLPAGGVGALSLYSGLLSSTTSLDQV